MSTSVKRDLQVCFMSKFFSLYCSAFLVNERKFFLLNCSLQTNVNKSRNTKIRDVQVHQTQLNMMDA